MKFSSLYENTAGTNSSKAVTPSGVFNFVKTYVTEAIEALKTLLRKEIAAAALAAVPIGTVIYYLGTEIPDGYLLTNGASVSKTDFSDLYDVIGDKFGNVDSTHFNLPNTHHRFLEGTTTLSEVGTYVEAGVPNIEGNFQTINGWIFSDTYGAISKIGGIDTTNIVQLRAQETRPKSPGVAFSAQASNGIYGSASTVQPAGLFVQCLIRYAA